jgi:hypothetical protein
MSRCVVNVATGAYVRGQERLRRVCEQQGLPLMSWADVMPPGSPAHTDIPYAFKAHALQCAAAAGYTSLLWADASILPIADMGPLFEKIERDGCWISRNGYRNSEWTCNAAYPLLGVTPEQNHDIEHVVATAFGLNLVHETGAAILVRYTEYAKNGAFRGPWKGGIGVQHRHDQTALSVCAWRCGVELTDPPAWFAYLGGEREDTVLVADSTY